MSVFLAVAGETYSVALLGDTHFDAEPESVYHANFDETLRNAKSRHREFRRNGEMWRDGGRSPSLVAASAALAASNTATRFVLQLGDMVQGDCDDPAMHRKMLDDAVRAIRSPYPGRLLFIPVMGNHDVRGLGAREVYFDWAKSFLSAELGRQVAYPVISFEIGGDLWLLCDFEAVDLDCLADEIDSHPDARFVFLVTHGPFTAPDSPSWTWRLGGKDTPEKRKRLMEALSRRHAIILSGHKHSTTYYRHKNESGGFSEMTVNSVWSKPALATAEPVHDRPEQYGTFSRERILQEKREQYDSDIAEWRACLVDYFFSRAAGHYRLDISDDGVTCAFYPGDARVPGRVFRLAEKRPFNHESQ